MKYLASSSKGMWRMVNPLLNNAGSEGCVEGGAFPPTEKHTAVSACQAARNMFPTDSSKSFQSFQLPVDNQVFQSFPVLQSAIACLPLWYLLLRVCRSAMCVLLWMCSLNLGSLRVPLQNHQIPSLSRRASKS